MNLFTRYGIIQSGGSNGDYIIKDGVVQNGFTVENVGADSYGTVDGLYVVEDNAVSTYGVYMEFDATNYNTLEFYAKHNIGSASYYGRVGQTPAGTIYGGDRAYVYNTDLPTEPEVIDISALTGTQSFTIGCYGASSGTNSITSVSNAILR